MTRISIALALALCACESAPACSDPIAVPAIASATDGSEVRVRVDNVALWRALRGGALASARLRMNGESLEARRADRHWSGGAPPAVSPVDLRAIDVTADVAAFLDGSAPNYGWIVSGAREGAELELCAGEPVAPDLIEVTDDGFRFRRSESGTPFVPAGANYDHDESVPCPMLIEEYWHDQWNVVEEDFAEMVELGFNVVRVHLQTREMMLDASTPNEENLIKLDQLVRMADRRGVALDVTGLGLYRRDLVPEWFAALDDDATMDTEALFWSAIAARYAEQPSIFFYDLQNEPAIQANDTDDVVSGPYGECDPDGEEGPLPPIGFSYVHFHFRHADLRWNEWVRARYPSEAELDAAWPDYPHAGESYAAIDRPAGGDAIERRRDQLLFRHEMGALWTERMSQAIRAHDTRHLITVGLTETSIPFQDRHRVDTGAPLYYTSFSPYYLRSSIDLVAIHVYPEAYDEGAGDSVLLSEMLLRGAHLGMPVILEETFPQIDHEQFEQFLSRTPGSVSGWLSFYWGRTPSELRAAGDLRSAILAGWIDRYSGWVRSLPSEGLERAPADASGTASVSTLALDPEARGALYDEYAAHAAMGERFDPVLAP